MESKKMKRSALKIILYTILLFLPLNSAVSGSTGLDFLKIGAGARAAGMGEAFCAGADDASAVYWNPAGLGSLPDREITFMYGRWFEDINYNFLAYACPLRKNKGTLAASFYLLNIANIQAYDNNDVPAGSFENNSRMLVLSYAMKTFEGITAGVNLKIIQDSIYNRAADGIACDFGFLYILENKKYRMGDLNFGLNIQNMGTGVRYITESFPLPVNLKLGVSVKEFMAPGLNLAVDLNVPQQAEKELGIGAEYAVFNKFFLRGGYYHGNNAGDGIRFGFGYGTGNTSFDYAFVPYDILGDTHRISLTWKFISKTNTMDKHYEQGMDYYNKGYLLNAQKEFSEVLRFKADHAEAGKYMSLIQEQLDLQQKKETEDKLKALKSRAEEHFNKGSEYYKKDNYEEACKEFLEAVKLCPEYPLAGKYYDEVTAKLAGIRAKEAEKYYNDGKIEYSRGNLEEAIAFWEKALSLNPEHDKTRQALKRAKEQLKEKK